MRGENPVPSAALSRTNVEMELSESERRFVRTAVRRKRLFLVLSVTGVVVAVALAAFIAYRRLRDPGYVVGARAAVVLLILTMARLNLRQFRYARVLEKMLEATEDGGNPGKNGPPPQHGDRGGPGAV
jgi:hypothetical protein